MSPWPWIGLILLVSAFFPYAASGLIAPWWAVVVMLVLWLLQMVLALSWFNRRPTWVPWLGVFSFVLWFAAMNAGGYFLNWTA